MNIVESFRKLMTSAVLSADDRATIAEARELMDAMKADAEALPVSDPVVLPDLPSA